MANNNNMIRMSGMNSGLDTEAIINALTANSKLKITKQNRQLLKYQATQEAYREIIGKMQSLKSKYFDILNSSSNLKGSSMWSKYSSTTLVDGVEKKVSGFSVSTSIDSTPGTYSIEVVTKATQATLAGSSLSSGATVKYKNDDNTSKYSSGQYGISVTVGSETKNIVFDGDADPEKVRENINNKLAEAFGESNYSLEDGVAGGGSKTEGLVYMDANGQFVSRDSKGLTISGVGEMKSDFTLNMGALESGNNAVSIQIGDQVVNVSFQTLKNDYFTTEQKKDDNGDPVFENGQPVYEPLSKDKQELYDQVKEDYIESKRYEDYKNWQDNFDPSNPTDAATKQRIENKALDKAQNENLMKYLDNKSALNSFLKDKYDIYKYNVEHSSGTAMSFENWKAANFPENPKEKYNEYAKAAEEAGETVKTYDEWKGTPGSITNSLFDEFEAEYYDKTDISQSPIGTFRLDEYYDKEYEKYKKGLADPSAALGKDQWKTQVVDENSAVYNETVKKGADRIVNKYTTGYELDRTGWKNFKYNEYEAYKEFVIDEDIAAFEARENIQLNNISNQTIIDHFNTSSINNSIGAAQIKQDDGVVNIKVDYDAGGNAVVSAEKSLYEYDYKKQYVLGADGKFEVAKDAAGNILYELDGNGDKIINTDSKGNPLYEKDEKGNYVFQKNADGSVKTESVDIAVTAARGSTNDFGVTKASSAVSQISNSTLISDLGVAAGADGKYSFTINGKSFSFAGDTTVKDMMRQVSASGANVKMTYSSLDNAFTLTSNEYGVNARLEIEDDGGLLAAIGLSGAPERGTNLVVKVNDQTLESSGNSVTVDGNTFTFAGVKEGAKFDVEVEKDYSAIKDVIKSFVEDYNKLIEDVYKMLDEKPDKDYYFLADADKEDMDLSEKQEEKWEAKAKQGLLYHDSTISTAMTRLRMSLLGYITGADGNDFGLTNMGIKTASDYKEHGKLVLDEDKLDAAIIEHGDDIMKLFSDKTDGIMVKFADALEGAVGTTGDKGTLINKAGLATGTSATDNFIYNQMKRITQNISRLEKRYEKEQDRLWKKYSAMESMLGTLNSQSTSITNYFGGGM